MAIGCDSGSGKSQLFMVHGDLMLYQIKVLRLVAVISVSKNVLACFSMNPCTTSKDMVVAFLYQPQEVMLSEPALSVSFLFHHCHTHLFYESFRTGSNLAFKQAPYKVQNHNVCRVTFTFYSFRSNA